MPTFELATLFDNYAEMSEGWNFLQDRRQSWDVEGSEWMWQRVFDYDRIRQSLVTSSIKEIQAGNIQCRESGVEQYFRQHENGPQAQSQRGVFIENRMVVFVTNYYKGYKKGRRVKIVHRYVPREVGELVVYYLWLVELFVRSLQDPDSEDKVDDGAEPTHVASEDEGEE
ncbi:hypothetical protein LTR81_027692 [Elasticomyces elasticus]